MAEIAGGQHVARPPVARILHPRHVADVGEHARTQVERLVRAVQDQDLLRAARHHAGHAQVFGKHQLQRSVAAIAVLRQVTLLEPHLLGDQLAPGGEGEVDDIREAGHEGARLHSARQRIGSDPAASSGQALAACADHPPRFLLRCGGGYRVGDEGARAHPAVQVALDDELVVHPHHGVPPQREIRRQGAGGRQRGAGGEPARDDGLADGEVEARAGARGGGLLPVDLDDELAAESAIHCGAAKIGSIKV